MLTCSQSTPQRFQCILLMHGRYVTDILKMCMKKFNAEKKIWTNLQGFDLHIAGGILKALLAANFLFCQFLLYFSFSIIFDIIWLVLSLVLTSISSANFKYCYLSGKRKDTDI